VVEASSRYVREVPEAHLLPPDIILSQGRRFVTENLYGDEAAALQHAVFGAFVRSFSPVEDRLGAVFSLLGPYSHNYFHWLTQHLPRVEDFLLWRTIDAPNAKLLLLAPGRWQIRLLELLGVSRELTLTYSERHSTAEVAAVASDPGYPGYPQLPATPERLTWLRSRILTALELKEQQRTRRLFVSRRDSGAHRPIANEEEVAQTLEQWGFQTVALGNLEIDDQVRLFAAARIVIAAHGAGLANLVFSTAPTVIELFPPEWVQPDFQALQRAQAFQALTMFNGGRHVGVSLQGSFQCGLRVDVEGLVRVVGEEVGD
jgi:capsular polysaccharide biosynthesis protein